MTQVNLAPSVQPGSLNPSRLLAESPDRNDDAKVSESVPPSSPAQPLPATAAGSASADPVQQPSPALPPSSPLTRAAPWLLLLAGHVLFRLPAFLNARGVHSDAAIVGLQARHMLQGEWSWFLWGAGYQASFDAALVALGFALTGPSALTLMGVPFVGHLIACAAAYDVVARRLGRWTGFLLSLPLVFTPQSINGVALYAPRQWSVTFLFLAVLALDRATGRAPRSAPRAAWLAAGAFAATFAIYLDLFGLQALVGLAIFAGACVAWSPRDGRAWAQQGGALVAGAAIGLGIVAWSRSQPMADATTMALTLSQIPANARLLWDTCLPWLLGAKVFVPGPNLYPDRWLAPSPVAVLQWIGAASLLVATAFAGVAVFIRRIPWDVRRLGGLGFVVTLSALGGFLISTMPSDLWSARYLAPIVWFAPFSLAPVAWWLRPRRFAIALTPYLVTAALGGWLAFGPYVDGPVPVRTPRGVAEDEAALAEVLRTRGVKYGAAQYWLAYRLTFLWDEDPIVIPLATLENRYQTYLAGYLRAPVVAYVFHPSESRAEPETYENVLREVGARYERLEIRGFTVLLHDRRQ